MPYSQLAISAIRLGPKRLRPRGVADRFADQVLRCSKAIGLGPHDPRLAPASPLVDALHRRQLWAHARFAVWIDTRGVVKVMARRKWSRFAAAVVGACILSGCGTHTVVETQHTVTVEGKTTVEHTPVNLGAPSLAALMSRVRSGVVRIQAVNCEGGEIGTGFLPSPHVIATVEHVVDGAISISILQNARSSPLGASRARIHHRISRSS